MKGKNPLHIMTVVGARPQFVKAAVLSRAIADHNASGAGRQIAEDIIHTGQHYDHNLSQCFFDEMGIPAPKTNLDVGSSSHGEATGAMLAGIEREILARKPDLVLVYGDTNSTLAGALAAAKLNVPAAHVEAGLRSFNRKMPEEINRVVADHTADLLFCPSEGARKQLAAEGITEGVEVVGDVMYDAVLFYRGKAIRPDRGPFALATVHRAENADDPERLRSLMAALEDSPVPVVLPLHPRTQKSMEAAGIEAADPVEVVEPLSYLSMLGHLEACSFVITDSGGLQKEAFFFSKKCLTVRDETEWTELVDIGANRVIGLGGSGLREAYPWAVEPIESKARPYGQGDAGKRIVNRLTKLP